MKEFVQPKQLPRSASNRRISDTIRAYLQLSRFSQTWIVMGGTWIGAFVANVNAQGTTLACVIVSNALLFSASVAFNDWQDVAEDQVNQPGRPIPSGRISRNNALTCACSMFVIALGMAFIANTSLGLAGMFVVLSSVLYTIWWKRVPLFGNAIVAIVSSYPLWCWYTFEGTSTPTFIALTASCVLFRFGAELAKTGEDVVGDREAGITTFATLKGSRLTNGIGFAFLGLAAVPLLIVSGWSMVVVAGITVSATLFVAATIWMVCSMRSAHHQSSILVLLERTVMVVMVCTLLLDNLVSSFGG